MPPHPDRVRRNYAEPAFSYRIEPFMYEDDGSAPYVCEVCGEPGAMTLIRANDDEQRHRIYCAEHWPMFANAAT